MDHISHFRPCPEHNCLRCVHCGAFTHTPDQHECMEMVKAERDALQNELYMADGCLDMMREWLARYPEYVDIAAVPAMMYPEACRVLMYKREFALRAELAGLKSENADLEMCNDELSKSLKKSLSDVERLRKALKRLVGYGDIYRYKIGETSPYEQAVEVLASAGEGEVGK